MFYRAYELFENRNYYESRDLFSKIIEESSDPRERFWSFIFKSRIEEETARTIPHDLLLKAHEIFPHRGEILYELGKYHYALGDLYSAKDMLERAVKGSFNGTCIRYEPEKYLEAPLAILVSIYGSLSKYNFQEESIWRLFSEGDPGKYDKGGLDYQHRWARHYNNAALEFLRAKEIRHGDRLVIDLPEGYGALGDNFIFSHIPRIAKESGKFKEVWISSRITYGAEDYKELVWEHNPYVDGFVDEPGTYSEIDMRRVMTHWQNILPSLNLLDSIMLLHNLDDGQRWHKPECYYKPKMSEKLRDKIVLDPGAKSVNLEGVTGDHILNKIRECGVNVDYVIENDRSRRAMKFPESMERLEPSNIYEWADIISSSKEYLCFNSGGYWLASALNVSPTHLALGNRNIPCWCPYDYSTIEIGATIYQ